MPKFYVFEGVFFVFKYKISFHAQNPLVRELHF